MKVLLIIACLLVTGCVGIDDYEEPVKEGISIAKTVAPFLDPVTGGAATPIALGGSTLALGLLALNKWLLAKRLSNAVKEVHEHPSSPDVLDQVKSAGARKVIIQIIGKNPCTETENHA